MSGHFSPISSKTLADVVGRIPQVSDAVDTSGAYRASLFINGQGEGMSYREIL